MSGPTPEQIKAAAEAEARLKQLLELGDINQANAVTLLYSDSGCGKSSLCATAAKYCWERYHRITEYIPSDLGGFGNQMLRLIRLGIVRAYNPQNHIEPFETMEDLSLGAWPKEVQDPYTGFALPDVELIPCQRMEWRVYCPQNHLCTTLSNKSSLNGFSRQCDTCKTLVNSGNWNRVEEVTLRAAHHKNVGLRIFDSLTSMEDWAMSDLASRAAKNMDTLAQGDKSDNALNKTGARITSGKYSFGANTPGHYGFAQNRVPGWIRNARGIPGMVMPPIFTALELRASDDTGKGSMPIYGPKIAGSAKTSDVPAWVGNCLHLSREMNERGVMEHRIWTMNHIDAGGTAPHLAKTRAEPGTLPPYIADLKDEPPFTRFSLGYFFDQLDLALEQGARQDAIDFPDAPVFQPLEQGEDVVMSSRAVSQGVINVQSHRPTGAPTLAPRPPAPAVIASPAPAGRPTVTAPVVAAPVASAPAPTATPPAPATAMPPRPVAPPVVASPAPAARVAPAAPPAQVANVPAVTQPPQPVPQPVTSQVKTTSPVPAAPAPVSASKPTASASAPVPGAPAPPAQQAKPAGGPVQVAPPAPPGPPRPPIPAATRPGVPPAGARPAVPPPPGAPPTTTK